MSEYIKHEKFLSQYLQEKVFHLSRIFKGLDKILFFCNSRSRVGKIEILDQGLSRFNLDKPWSSRQVQGQLFQGQGLSFKGEYSIFIQGFFKGNPWNSSKFKATSRGTFSRILQPLLWIWGKGILRLHYAHYVHFVKQNNIMHFISILSRKLTLCTLCPFGYEEKGIARLYYARYVHFV